jgi:hypothetical protein
MLGNMLGDISEWQCCGSGEISCFEVLDVQLLPYLDVLYGGLGSVYSYRIRRMDGENGRTGSPESL